ncbi:MAG: ABC transporter permease [Gammaproteobacteria bacterium]|nr:MAG: ABC transporter permease [Gammaproteobacteria bacterium]
MLNRQNIVSYLTISRKETIRFLRIWPQTILPSAITIALYYVIFGNLIGPRIGDMEGYSYIKFIVPGLTMMSVITNSYANVVASFFSAKFQRYIDELLISPTANSIILLGYITGGILRGCIVGVIVLLISVFFTDLSIDNLYITASIIFLTSVLFSLAGFLNGIFARKFDDVSIVPTFVLTPLTYLGGVFYSITMLPEFWQTVSLGNPILYMVNAFRYGMLGQSDINIFTAYLLIIGFIIALYWINIYLLRKGFGIRT